MMLNLDKQILEKSRLGYSTPRISLVYTSLLVVLGATEFGVFFDPLRHLKYLPLPLFFILLVRNGYKLDLSRLPLILPFVIIVLWSLIKSLFGQFSDFLQLTIIFSSVCIFFFPFEKEMNLKFVSVALLGYFILSVGFNIQLDFSFNALIRSETSTGETNMLPFLFGLMTLYFLLVKNRFWFIVNLLGVIISFKRIVIIGIIISFILYFTPKYIKNILLNKYVLIGFNILSLWLVYAVADGFFNDLVKEYVGLSIGHFTQGRSLFMAIVIPEIQDNWFEVLWFGMGQGNLLLILQSALDHKELFHNDIFKLFAENGLVIFLLFFYFLYSTKNVAQKVVLIFFNVLLFTDNVLTYTPVVLLCLILLYKLEIKELSK